MTKLGHGRPAAGFHRTRASDGTARLWLGRRRTIGVGEVSSGLRYDAAEDASG